MNNLCLFFFSTETTEDTMREGVCFGVSFGEARRSDEQDDKKEKESEVPDANSD